MGKPSAEAVSPAVVALGSAAFAKAGPAPANAQIAITETPVRKARTDSPCTFAISCSPSHVLVALTPATSLSPRECINCADFRGKTVIGSANYARLISVASLSQSLQSRRTKPLFRKGIAGRSKDLIAVRIWQSSVLACYTSGKGNGGRSKT